MQAAWECRSENRAPIGSYLDPMFSFAIQPTTLRKLPSSFALAVIRRLRILQLIMSCNRHQRKKCLKRSVRRNRSEADHSKIVRRLGLAQGRASAEIFASLEQCSL